MNLRYLLLFLVTLYTAIDMKLVAFIHNYIYQKLCDINMMTSITSNFDEVFYKILFYDELITTTWNRMYDNEAGTPRMSRSRLTCSVGTGIL